MFFNKKPEPVYRSYKEKSYAELEAEVEQAWREEQFNKIKNIVIVVVILFVICPDAFLYWVRFATPHFAKSKTSETINILQDPVQIDIPDGESEIIKYSSLENHKTYDLIPKAEYSISGMVLAKNFYFWGNYLPGGRRPFQDVSLIDIGLAWRDFADKDVLKYYSTVSAKDKIERALWLTTKHKNGFIPYSVDEIRNQYSHTHVIPKNASIMHALLYTHKYQKIKMEGYLVDVDLYGDLYSKKYYAMTSLSRSDTNQSSRGYGRGGGACEIMYVERVQIGNKVYE